MKAIIPTLSKRQLRQAAEEVKRTYDNENRKALMRVIYISVIALHRNAGYGAERCRKHIKHIRDIIDEYGGNRECNLDWDKGNVADVMLKRELDEIGITSPDEPLWKEQRSDKNY